MPVALGVRLTNRNRLAQPRRRRSSRPPRSRRHMWIRPKTPITLPLGNYPIVTAPVLDRPRRAAEQGERAGLRFETISSEEEFARLAGEWDRLVRAMPRPSPFLLHGWLLEWWRHYGEGCRLSVQAAFRGEALVGALPLVAFTRRGLRVLTFVGARQS